MPIPTEITSKVASLTFKAAKLIRFFFRYQFKFCTLYHRQVFFHIYAFFIYVDMFLGNFEKIKMLDFITSEIFNKSKILDSSLISPQSASFGKNRLVLSLKLSSWWFPRTLTVARNRQNMTSDRHHLRRNYKDWSSKKGRYCEIDGGRDMKSLVVVTRLDSTTRSF